MMKGNPRNFSTPGGLSRRQLLSLGAAGIVAVGLDSTQARSTGVSAQKSQDGIGSVSPRIEAAFAALDQDKLVKLAMELCNVPSPLGNNTKFAQLLNDRMYETGLTSRLLSFAPNQSNVLGTLKGTGGGRTLMFNINLDNDFAPAASSVPPSQIIENEWISGAGIWNMKGSLAAALAAVTAVRKAGITLSGDVLIAGVAGMADQTLVDTRLKGEHPWEAIQGYGVGTKYLLAQGIRANFAIVGTPTSFKIIQQHIGTTAVRIDVFAKRPSVDTLRIFEDCTHPDFFLRPSTEIIHHAAEIVQVLQNWMSDYQRRNTVAGQVPGVYLSAIEGGAPWYKTDPAKCSLFLFVGTAPGTGATAVVDELRALLAKACERHPNLQVHAETYLTDPAHFVPDNYPIVTSLQTAHADVFGNTPDFATVPWHSDAGLLTEQGIPSVDYGPAGKYTISPDGTTQEFVRINDLVSCARVYIDLIVRLCGKPGQ